MKFFSSIYRPPKGFSIWKKNIEICWRFSLLAKLHLFLRIFEHTMHIWINLCYWQSIIIRKSICMYKVKKTRSNGILLIFIRIFFTFVDEESWKKREKKYYANHFSIYNSLHWFSLSFPALWKKIDFFHLKSHLV